MILRVLAEIAVGARLGDGLHDGRPVDIFQSLELRGELLVSGARHGRPLDRHRFTLTCGGNVPARSVAQLLPDVRPLRRWSMQSKVLGAIVIGSMLVA